MIASKTTRKNFSTTAVHAGEKHKDQFGSHINPIYQTSTFVFNNVAEGASAFQGEEKHSFATIVSGSFLKILCIWCVWARSSGFFGSFLCALFIATVPIFLGTEFNQHCHELASGAAG